MKHARLIAACAALVAATVATSTAYSTYASWSRASASFYINPTNSDVSSSAAVAAFQTALNVWNTQGGTPFRYQYAGTANDTSTSYDNRNVLIFRNDSGGGAVASTYSWWDASNHLLDADIVVWDGSYTFFTGTSGCSGGLYIEDIATHELGHALGLNHSDVADATMYPSVGWCSQELRTLASDDIAGIRSLYGGSTPPPNTAPTVVITSPANGATYPVGSVISLGGTAYDSQDGDLTSKIQWSKNSLSNLLPGVGGQLSQTLDTVGTQTFYAQVTDSGGLKGSSQISITVTALTQSSQAPATATLSANGRKVKGLEKADLSWTGLTGPSFDIYRNGTSVKTQTNNVQSYTDPINAKGAGTYNYLVCTAGTQTCTNSAKVTF